MATFLDVTGLQHFSVIFVFLFVWIVVYAILLWTKALGSNNFINALVGLLLAIFVAMSQFATEVIAAVAPFIAVLFVLIVLVGMASKMLGADMEAFPAVKGVMIVFIVLVIIIGIGVKIRSAADNAPESGDVSKTINLIFHPKFMGMVLLFAIAIFTIALLVSGGRHVH